MTRIDILKSYLARLAADAAADGKFAGMGSNRAEAAARALLSGAGGMLEALYSDVRLVAGEKGTFAAGAVAGLASRFAEGAVRYGIGKAVEAVKGTLDKDKRAYRAAGKAFKDLAKEIGK